MTRYTPIKVSFKSFKDIEVLHEIHLNELKQSLSVIMDRARLHKVKLELLNLLEVVRYRDDLLWSEECNKE